MPDRTACQSRSGTRQSSRQMEQAEREDRADHCPSVRHFGARCPHVAELQLCRLDQTQGLTERAMTKMRENLDAIHAELCRGGDLTKPLVKLGNVIERIPPGHICITVAPEEHSFLLAAARYVQTKCLTAHFTSTRHLFMDDPMLLDTATNGGDHPALAVEEIDALCESINHD